MNILESLAQQFKSVKINKQLAVNVREYRVGYLIKNSEFFSKPLTGTVPVYFKTSEVSYFFDQILQINESAFMASRKEMEGLDLSHKVDSDHFNLALFYLTHRALNTRLPGKQGELLARDLLLVFCYRTVAALISSRFNKYLATEAEAYATYENLSNKFILKRVKSWAAYCEYRVDALLDPKGIHRGRLLSMESGQMLLVAITSLQTAIASTFNIIFPAHLRTVEAKESTQRKGTIVSDFGEESTGNITEGTLATIERVLDAVPYPHFLDTDIINVVVKLSPQVKSKVLTNLITVVQEGAVKSHHKLINQHIRDALVWMHRYLWEAKSDVDLRNIKHVLAYLRGGLSASRTTDGDLLALRDKGNQLLFTLTKRKDQQGVAVQRNALWLYLFIFAKLKA